LPGDDVSKSHADIIADVIPFTAGCTSLRSLWMWSSEHSDRLIVVFLNDDEPSVWQVGTDVLGGNVLSDDMRITYTGEQACLSLDGHDGGVDRVIEMHAPAQRLKDFSLDIQVAREMPRDLDIEVQLRQWGEL
jgi:hypothetical protein